MGNQDQDLDTHSIPKGGLYTRAGNPAVLVFHLQKSSDSGTRSGAEQAFSIVLDIIYTNRRLP